MTNTEKRRKLVNAVRQYRGVRDMKTFPKPTGAERHEVWTLRPAPSYREHVKLALRRFGEAVDVESCLERIDKFESFEDFYTWLDGDFLKTP